MKGLRLAASLALFWAASAAADSPLLSVDFFLNRAVHELGSDTVPACAQCDEYPPKDNKSYFARVNFPWDAEKFCNPVRWRPFCDQVQQSCQKAFGHTGCILDGEPRFRSSLLRLKILTKAKSFMQTLRKDPEIKALCCAGNASCEERLAKVDLRILANGGPRHDEGYYKASVNEIHVSEATLLHQPTEENLEYILAHEFGHACDHARSGQIARFDSCVGGVRETLEQMNFENILGVKTKDCVVKALEAEGARWTAQNRKFCMGEWLREAFATAIVLTRLKGLSHWSLLCAQTGSSKIHGDTRVYIGCLLDRFPLKNHFCGRAKK